MDRVVGDALWCISLWLCGPNGNNVGHITRRSKKSYVISGTCVKVSWNQLTANTVIKGDSIPIKVNGIQSNFSISSAWQIKNRWHWQNTFERTHNSHFEQCSSSNPCAMNISTLWCRYQFIWFEYGASAHRLNSVKRYRSNEKRIRHSEYLRCLHKTITTLFTIEWTKFYLSITILKFPDLAMSCILQLIAVCLSCKINKIAKKKVTLPIMVLEIHLAHLIGLG